MDPRRYAAIDIGTVTCRLLVAEVNDSGLQVLSRAYAITNLGEGVDASGVLKPEAIERVATKVAEYLQTVDSFRTEACPRIPVIAMATSAARDASNADEFTARLHELGIELTVIPGEREAALSFAGASAAFPGKTLLVTDVGGGSSELVTGLAGADPQLVHSFNIGCRRVTERFFKSDPAAAEEVAQAREWMRAQFQTYFDQLAEQGISPEGMVSVAGTATSVVAIDKALEPYDSSQVHGVFVPKEKLHEVGARMLGMTVEERRHVTGLDPQRAPVIAAGMLILDVLVDLAGLDGFTASEADILEGIVMDADRKAQLGA